MQIATPPLNRKQRRAMEKNKRKQTQKSILAPTAKPTNTQAIIQAFGLIRNHMPNRKKFFTLEDDEPSTQEEVNKLKADSETAFENLVYQRNIPESVLHFETLTRSAKILAEFLTAFERNPEYRASLLEIVQDCEEVIKSNNKPIYDSPTQLRNYYEPLNWLIDAITRWASILSQKSQNIIATYSTAIHVCAYVLKIYQTPSITMSAVKIINGANSREFAKSIGVKESVFRTNMLQIAKYLYKIGAVIDGCKIKPANSIPEMRTDDYKSIGDTDKLGLMVEVSFTSAVEVFEEYGIDLLNIKAYQRQIIQSQRTINNFQTH